MKSFLVRVELHDATWPDDYDDLHVAMANAGFARHILAYNGKLYRLPTAEYVVEGDYTIEYVRSVAADAALTTGRAFMILVVEYSKWAGQWLPEAA
jgi:hypothetical protein